MKIYLLNKDENWELFTYEHISEIKKRIRCKGYNNRRRMSFR